MKIIAHRGNINGPNPKMENKPEYVLNSISLGFDAEVDVWFVKDSWFLGHDTPDYKIDVGFLKNKKLWCHAKNLDALVKMKELNIHCFWHQKDDYTLTSMGYVWVYPGKKLSRNSICVMPELESLDKQNIEFDCFGICTDRASLFKELLN